MSMSGARKPDRPERKKVNLSETVAKPVRKFVFDYFLENSRAPVLEEIMRTFHLVRSEARDVLEELEAAHHVIRLPGTQRILMANPFSALDTPFAVKIGNKRYLAGVRGMLLHSMLWSGGRAASIRFAITAKSPSE